MNKKLKKLVSGTSVTLCALIAFSLPTQVFAQNLPINTEVKTQTPNEEQSSDEYKTGNILSEIKDERDEYSKQFRLDDGTTMAVSYKEPIHYKNAAGEWVDYDNSLKNETVNSASPDEVTEEYTNKKSDFKVNYSKKSKENSMVKIKDDNQKISWGYKDTNKVKSTIVNNDEELTDNDKFTTLKNLTSEITYENIYDDVDVQYFTTTTGVKENIILKNKNARSDFYIQYKFNNLTAKSVDDKTVELLNSKGDAVYKIEAPFMFDNGGKTSTDLTLSITEQKKNKLTLKVSADKRFLSDCSYPVTIDPQFTTSQNWQKSQCTYVDSSKPSTCFGYGSTSGYTGTVNVGTWGNGMYRTYFKMNSLPTLNKGDMVVEAHLNLHLINNDFYQDMNIGAYSPNASWSQDKLTWKNQPSYNSKVVDYETFTKNESETWHSWNVTSCVKRWYNGEANNGIMLKSLDESNEMQCAEFYSSNYPSTSTPRPLFTIVYRNNKGLEDYWTYSSFSVGSAGTAYVNDYSGNLTFVTSDASTASGYAPASVQHVYNGYMAGDKYSKTTPYVGRGWRLNIQQTLLPSSEYGLTGTSKDNYPYVYTDEDGTEHYFYKKTENGKTKYLDEDGLKLELTTSGSGSSKYAIKDEKDNYIYFNTKGLLTSTKDSNGNKTTINYASDGTTINSVTDGSNKKILLQQTAGSDTKYIRYTVDPAGRKTEFRDSSGLLYQINKPDGSQIKLTYDNDKALKSITDIDGYKVVFEYTSTASGKKVSAIQEYGKDGTAGQKITFDRTKYNTTVKKTYGADGIANTDDDLTSTYQFDEFGRTISIKSETKTRDLGASVYTYTDGVKNSAADNIKMLNKVNSNYSTGSNSVNLISNSNMETDSSWIKSAWGESNTFEKKYDTSQHYFGKQSLAISVSKYEGTSRGRVYQDISNTVLEPGKTYTLSGYIKTVGVVNGSSDNAGAFICAESHNSDGTFTPSYSDFVVGNTDSAVDNGWQRVSTTFKVPKNSSKTRINLALKQSTGTVYFDGIQLESYTVANNYNMLENSGFEKYSSNGLPTSWYDGYSTLNNAIDCKSEAHQQGKYSFRIKGEAGKVKSICQNVNITGKEEDTYIVSGWAYANAVPKNKDDTRKFKISVKITYSDNSTKYKTPAPFNYSISGWQYTSAAFNLSDGTNKVKTPKTITIYLSYQNQGNYAYFDNICLVKDNAMSYTYDKDGKVISVVDNSKKQSTMEYKNSDLTKNIDTKGYAYTYGYDKAHNVTKATSQTGMNYNYTYAKGLATSLEVKCDSKVTDVGILKSEVTYDSNGLLSSATDQDGNKVEYKYDGNKGTLTQTTDKLDSKNPVVTDYTYDSSTDQIKSVKQSDSNGNEYSIAYSYSSKSKLLEKISRDGTDYSIKYDEFGNKIDSKVGSQSLASYSYGANNRPLLSLTYGTGQNVSYAYDEFGNVKTRKYNGKTAFNWYSDRGGNIIRENDYLNKRLTDFTYDTTGRLVRQTVADSSVTGSSNKLLFGFEYSYDLNNNITQLVTKTTDKTVKNKFTFGKDNLPATFTLSTGKKVDYTYDGLNRLTKTSLTTSTNTPIDTTYTYFASKRGSGYTTTKLKSETINGEKYEYKYDVRSNITDVTKDGVLQYHYGYDMMNQLVSVNDRLNGKVYNYTYDAGGNLISETVTDSNGTTSNAYEYNNSNWGDVLTSYNGQSITYDEIGNPLTYRDGMSMTWKNGRQLATFTNGDTSISYGYDSDSVRTTKTVNGVKYTYAYLNGQLLYETRGDAKFYYSYDSNGILYNVRYTLTDGGTEYSYYYTHNSRGDIVGIYNGAGELKAHYEYDAWGNVISITDNNGNAITNPNHIGNLNPFRYRGYYQDTETGLYYLMSRYYDTITHRFINADGYFQSGGSILDANTFAYCRNNPIMNSDCTGTSCSKHRSYYVPNCGYCDPSYIHEMNEKIDWLNRVYNTSPEHRIVKVNIDGSRVYGDATLPTVSDGFVTIYSGASTFGGAFTSGYSQALPYAAVTTLPMTAYNIYSYYNDPRLTTEQAKNLTALEVTNFAGTMLLTVAAVSSPPGWVALAVTGVTVVASWVGSEIISHQKNDYISSNKESGLY